MRKIIEAGNAAAADDDDDDEDEDDEDVANVDLLTTKAWLAAA